MADKDVTVTSADPSVGKVTIDAAEVKDAGIKIPADLSKVSNSKAKELVEAGLVEDRDVPGKMYKRKVDGFTARIPNYTYEAYLQVHKDEWEEIKLTTDPGDGSEAPAS